MKVYFDARMIDHPGIGRYIRCLLPLIANDKELDLYILGNPWKINKFLDIDKNVINFDPPIYSIQEQLGFCGMKKIVKCDILHVPHYNVPVLTGFNLVATVHDLIHIAFPEGASGKMAPLYMKFMMNRIIDRASGVICVSNATKAALKILKKGRADNCLDGKVRVIYEGVDDVFDKITDKDALNNVRKKYSLPDKFLLYVGSVRRHKNITVLLDAFNNFRKKNREVSLVMIGRRSQQIDLTGDGVMYLGELASDKELALIYNLASCLFNLSLYEGFGLTILEAQKCGLPIVCSDIPVHREIAGFGALFSSPSYIDQIYENLYNVLFNKAARESLVLKGFENVKRFSWSETAKQTLDLYRKIHDEGSDNSRLAAGHAGRRKNPQCFLQNISSG